ncbi:MAG: hypothetical protein M0009_09385 [Deltaproteobacteria bacterium]|nr:hypothetical protein [Deltaproteobacteria bacterium]
MDQKKKIEGRVAAILNAHELAINIGSDAGVVLGMKFAILAESPMIVKDPITGKVLDQIDREKVRVEATEVRPMIAICRTFRIKHIAGGPLSTNSLIEFMSGKLTAPAREIPETLRLEDSSVPPPLPEEDSYVKVKDRVIEVTEK